MGGGLGALQRLFWEPCLGEQSSRTAPGEGEPGAAGQGKSWERSRQTVGLRSLGQFPPWPAEWMGEEWVRRQA